jgi:signal transduction histidine kinase
MAWWKRATGLLLSDAGTHERPFNLSRWFALLSALAIGLVSSVVATLLSAHFTERMLDHDGRLTAGFIDSITVIEPAEALFDETQPRSPAGKEVELFEHIAAIGDTLRINAYGPTGLVVWSTDRALVGQRFGANDELAAALKGALVVHSGTASEHPKLEHAALRTGGGPFVENYVPVWSADRSRVIGVIEVYRVPAALFDTLATGRQLTWAGAAVASAVLFLILWMAIRRAERVMHRQREQLLKAQTLATVGELSRAVAHSLRNPLAGIRSTAELELQQPTPPNAVSTAAMRDIVGLVDRIDRLLTDLLTYSAPGANDGRATTDISQAVRRSLDAFAQEFRRRRVEVQVALPERLPAVTGDERLLAQAFASVMSNSLEALPDGGRIEVSGALSEDHRTVQVSVSDSGIGMPREQVENAFEPFYTKKARGLGIGLALVKRIVELSQGQVALESEPGAGTTVRFTFRTAHGAST